MLALKLRGSGELPVDPETLPFVRGPGLGFFGAPVQAGQHSKDEFPRGLLSEPAKEKGTAPKMEAVPESQCAVLSKLCEQSAAHRTRFVKLVNCL